MAMDEREVILYVYDLSQGLARQFSTQFLGTYIEAVYHTSIVLSSNEYYYGHGLQVTSPPGTTHHGTPMDIIKLGSTSLPDAVVEEYLESLKTIYSPEAYDLFMHNCNNFTNDFSVFLTGKGIPDYIVSLPRTVLETPFGRMLRPQLEAALRPVTNAPNVAGATTPVGRPVAAAAGGASKIKLPRNLTELHKILDAKPPAVLLYFTSPTCGPCRVIGPVVSQLAETYSQKLTVVKVDVSVAHDIASQYSITAVPTFITLTPPHGDEKLKTLSGANEAGLRAMVDEVIRIAYPPHPHTSLSLPSLLAIKMTPVLHPTHPPFPKVLAKLPKSISAAQPLTSMITFLQHRASKGERETPLPSLVSWAAFLRTILTKQADIEVEAPSDEVYYAKIFPVVDIFRATLVDQRVSSYFTEEVQRHHNQAASSAENIGEARSIVHLLLTLSTTPVSEDGKAGEGGIPYQLRLVTLQALANLFSTPLFPPSSQKPDPTTSSIPTLLTNSITSSLLDSSHKSVRHAAATLAFNLALHVQKLRSTQALEILAPADILDLTLAIGEAIGRETEEDGWGGVKALVCALGLLVYSVPREEGEEVLETLGAVGVAETLRGVMGGKWKREVGGVAGDVVRIVETGFS
ncbi:PPPDE putative peptidase domain-containing protein [Peziza echinospora]|nr:PPPDE putative peptidase domain-containing protein [Peziza echinospora]